MDIHGSVIFYVYSSYYYHISLIFTQVCILCILSSDTTVIPRSVPSQCLKALEFFNDVVQAGVEEEGFASWAQIQSFEGQVPNAKHAPSRRIPVQLWMFDDVNVCMLSYVLLCSDEVM